MSAVEIDPAGRRLAIADHEGHVRLQDAVSGKRRVAHTTASFPRTLRFSPDGSRLAIHGGYLLEVLDARTGRLIAQDTTTGASASDAPRSHLGFSRDSRVLVAASSSSDGNALEIGRWDARTGAELDEPRVVDGLEPLAVFAGGSRVLAAERRGVVILDTATLATLERFPVRPVTAAVSDDGRTLALGTARGAVHFVDVASGATRTPPGGHERAVVDARFAAGGKVLVTVGADARLIVWDAPRAHVTESIVLPDEAVGVAIAPDGRTAYEASADGAVLTWDVTGERRLGRPVDTGAAVAARAVAADGSVYARVLDDGSVEIVETRGFSVVQRLALEAIAVAVAKDARAIAVASAEQRHGRAYWAELRPALWEPGTHHEHVFARRLRWPFTFSVDGRRLVARGPAEYAVTSWDLASATRLATIDFSHAPMEIAMSPDARTHGRRRPSPR